MEDREGQVPQGPAPRVMVTTPMHPDTEGFIVRAAKASGVSRAKFMREASVAAATVVLGEQVAA